AKLENKKLANSKYYGKHKKSLSNRRKFDFNETVTGKKSSKNRRQKRPNSTIRESKYHCGNKRSWVKQRLSKNKEVYNKEN
ncbi:4332_t:CDS:1, partial [Dentiscutata erythropus]